MDISTISQLQAITDMSASYALACNIDASETATWNDGEGFELSGYVRDVMRSD